VSDQVRGSGHASATGLCGEKPVTTEAVATASSSEHGPVTWAPGGTKLVVVKAPAAAVCQWTNRHVAETTIQWFPDNRRLLVVDSNKRSFGPLTQTPDTERDPKLSAMPDQVTAFSNGI
jgi:hypothetical protein